MPVDLSNIYLQGQESFSQRELQGAQARHFDSLSRKTDLEVEEQERMNELDARAAEEYQRYARGNVSSGDDPTEGRDPASISAAEPWERMSRFYMENGAMERAQDYAVKASEMRKRESDIENDAVTRQQNRLENIIKTAGIVSSAIGTTLNDGEFNAGLDELDDAIESGAITNMTHEQIAEIRAKGWSPEIVDYYNTRAIEAKDRAQMELTAAGQRQQLDIAQGNARREQQRIELQEARDAETARHNRTIEKAAGNKTSNTPTNNELQTARAAVRSIIFPRADLSTDDKDNITDANFLSAVDWVASKAKQIRDADPTIMWATALNRAAQKAKDSGRFREEYHQYWGTDRAHMGGQTPETSIPMPPRGTPKSELEVGVWYNDPKLGIVQYTGTGFKKAPKAEK